MERKEDDDPEWNPFEIPPELDCDWYVIDDHERPPSSPRENANRNLAMADQNRNLDATENHHSSSPASFVAELPRFRSPYRNHNYSSQLSDSEINPQIAHSPPNPITSPNVPVRLNPSSLNPSGDAQFLERYFEARFGHLNLSSPSRHSQLDLGFPEDFDFGSSVPGNNSLIDPSELLDAHLRWMRIQSAVRGQMDPQRPPQDHTSLGFQESLERFSPYYPRNENPNSNFVNGSDQYYSEHNGGRNLISQMNIFPRRSTIRDRTREISSNGFESRNNISNSSVVRFNNLPIPSEEEGPNLLELRGRIYLLAKDRYWSSYLVKKLGERKPEEVEMIFSEVRNRVGELMVDQFGNPFVQKLFEVCNQDQITQMLILMISDERYLMSICCDVHGTRAMQKFIDLLTTKDQRSLAVRGLTRIARWLIKCPNGHRVIQICLNLFSNRDTKHLVRVAIDNCVDIGIDKNGCCILQQCVARAEDEVQERLVAEITANAVVLSESPYGNYVVQFVLGMTIPRFTAGVLAQLTGNYVRLSMNKYASNVVEKCLKTASRDQLTKIITEIINSPNFLTFLQDPYGNYVAQCALDTTKVC
ncbi:hypothetical protein U1Q18_041889 [Sarracenia purpurea var. burkii]